MVESKTKNKIVLLDAHAIIHRAYHAMPDFTSSTGEPTGALYGVSTMLLKIANDLKPDYIFACYDLPKPTFRHAAYSEYKAGRQKSDDNLALQLGTSRNIFEAFSVPIYEKEGFEADDIIGTLAEILKKEKENEIIIASGDMDTMQLIDGKKVMVYTLKKGINDTIMYDEKAVIDRFLFKPKQIPDYKGLAGDPSDNIVGIKGIGAKTATNLILDCGTIEGIYKKLKKEKDNFTVTGVTPRIKNLLIEGEEDAIFSKTLATIRLDAPVKFVLPEEKWKKTLDLDKVNITLDKYGFKSLKERVKFLKEEKTHNTVNKGKINKKEAQEINISEREFKDLQVLTWLLFADRTNPKIEDILQAGEVSEISEAKKALILKLEKEENLLNLYTKLETPLIKVVEEMRENGILLDTKYLKELQKNYEKDIYKLTKDIYKLTEKEFNINSPKQLGEVLFEDLKLSIKGIKKTTTGAKSTNIDTLEKLKDEHPVIEKIMEYRELEKTLNTYIIPLPTFVKEDGKVHSDFIQTGAATGRFSSLDPNMQNMPTTLEEGKNIRKAFMAEKGNVLLAFDYSQIDLRVAAMLSGDEKLLDAFRKNEDVHTAVAMQVFGVDKETVTSEMRRHAKTINFGILYGMGVTALKAGLGTDRKDAQEFYDTYKKTFSTLTEYLEGVKENARNIGYTETLYGRRRPMPLLRSPIPFLRAQGDRMAINAPIQGTTADIMRFALVDVSNAIKKAKMEKEAKLLLQIHDEIVLEVKNEYINKVSNIVKDAMESILEKYSDMEVVKSAHIPLTVSIKEGNTLGGLKEV